MITQEYLKSILEYDPETGLFIWLNKPSKFGPNIIGKIAGCVHNKGYYHICIKNKMYLSHRLAWLYMTGEWPSEDIDHKDGDGFNNRWCNLREATDSQNLGNQKKHSNNTSGFKGVSWDKQAQKWMVRIQINGKPKFLGYVINPSEGASIYKSAAEKYFKEFARTE